MLNLNALLDALIDAGDNFRRQAKAHGRELIESINPGTFNWLVPFTILGATVLFLLYSVLFLICVLLLSLTGIFNYLIGAINYIIPENVTDKIGTPVRKLNATDKMRTFLRKLKEIEDVINKPIEKRAERKNQIRRAFNDPIKQPKRFSFKKVAVIGLVLIFTVGAYNLYQAQQRQMAKRFEEGAEVMLPIVLLYGIIEHAREKLGSFVDEFEANSDTVAPNSYEEYDQRSRGSSYSDSYRDRNQGIERCPKCSGTGEIFVTHGDGSRSWEDCNICDGTGYIERGVNW